MRGRQQHFPQRAPLLDEACEDESQIPNPQRVCRATSAENDKQTLRLLIVDAGVIRVRGRSDDMNVASLGVRAERLLVDVRRARSDWGTRWHPRRSSGK